MKVSSLHFLLQVSVYAVFLTVRVTGNRNRMIRAFLKNYLPRHRNRYNQYLHIVGVPLTFVGTPWTLLAGFAWYWPIACFVCGYGLQFAGHAVEGNDAGEIVFLKKRLGMPYTEYGPGSERSSSAEQRDDRTSG